ncbi:MAG: LuxR C-terminal-related transcriptional regulator [Bacteroidales bacterium]|nr:LuxR C-terminal-related transcriptional regulator [Bacteroidales bacterium]
MDKYFEPINRLYLSQPFAERGEEGKLNKCLHIAEVYSLVENAIVSMGDSIRNCSYCFFGGLANLLGLSDEERCPTIPSLYEEFIFSRANQDDLMLRHAHELAYIRLTEKKTPDERRDYILNDNLRMRDKDGVWQSIRHRMVSLEGTTDGCYWLNICIYTLCHDNQDIPKIVNTRTGECHILTIDDYVDILSSREIAVLRLIDNGLQSKEIADNLYISVNTVHRHRQNILQKLRVGNAIEACKMAKAMGLIP